MTRTRSVRPRVRAADKKLAQQLVNAVQTDGLRPQLPTFRGRMTVNRVEIVELGEGDFAQLQARGELWVKRHYVQEGGAITGLSIEAVPLGPATLVPVTRTDCRPRVTRSRTECITCGLCWKNTAKPPPCGRP